MSDQRDELLAKIVAAVEGFSQRLTRLERALAENAELKLELAELQAAHDMAQDEQSEINDLLAAHLGGALVKIERPGPRPRLVVDNDNPSPGDR